MRYFALFTTLFIVRAAECNIACLYEGYDGGDYIKDNCRCYVVLDYEAVKSKKYAQSKVKSED